MTLDLAAIKARIDRCGILGGQVMYGEHNGYGDFVFHARSDVPLLVAEVEHLRPALRGAEDSARKAHEAKRAAEALAERMAGAVSNLALQEHYARENQRLRAALGYSRLVIENYALDARAIQTTNPGYCQGEVYLGALARIDAMTNGG